MRPQSICAIFKMPFLSRLFALDQKKLSRPKTSSVPLLKTNLYLLIHQVIIEILGFQHVQSQGNHILYDNSVFKGTWYALRILAMYGAPKTSIFYILFDISLNTQVIKNLKVLFWQKVPRWEKSNQIGKVTSSGRTEIENVKNVFLTLLISAPPPGGAFKLWLDFFLSVDHPDFW